jgi:hypothetical protein
MTWLAQINEVQAIDAHLNDRPPIQLPTGENIKVTSGFYACLCETRAFTGRNSNGAVVDFDKCRSWLGNAGYLILLDQIGSCFKDANRPAVSGASVQKALAYFSHLSSDDIDAIYALRCALAHDYSLVNKKGRNPSLQHQFALTGGTNTLIVKPSQPWDGDLSNRTQDNQTVIDMKELGDLVESVYRRLLTLASNRALEVVLSGGKDELIMRYTYAYQVP